MKRELLKRETNYQPLVTRKQPCPNDHGLTHFDESWLKNHSRTLKNDARFASARACFATCERQWKEVPQLVGYVENYSLNLSKDTEWNIPIIISVTELAQVP